MTEHMSYNTGWHHQDKHLRTFYRKMDLYRIFWDRHDFESLEAGRAAA